MDADLSISTSTPRIVIETIGTQTAMFGLCSAHVVQS